MDRMSAQDASFLHIEDGNNHMHIASVAVFEGPPPAYDELLEMVGGKLPLVPRYRQKVRFVPLELGRPVWVDDAHFNICYHVRHTALPPPGGVTELRNLVGRLMSQALDRSKPLWEMWVVEGLEDGHWALVSKVHHCMVDGVSGTDLLAVVLDREPQPSPPVADAWDPQPEPSDAMLLADALADRVSHPVEQLRGLPVAARSPKVLAVRAGEAVRGLSSLRRLARPTPPTSIVGPIGPHRRYTWARGSLADVKVIRSRFGGTINDVVLTAITRGFRDLILSRGESVEDRVVRSLVPVSVRRADERGSYNNRVSAMFADLPVGIADPVERLHAVSAQMEGLKERKQAVAGEVLTSLSGFAPPLLLALGTRLVARVPQRNVNTVTTNVPGPQFPLYALGRRMLEAFPYVPIQGSVRVGLAIFSYVGRLGFGITGDYDGAPDIDVLAAGIEEGLAELVKLAEAQAPA